MGVEGLEIIPRINPQNSNATTVQNFELNLSGEEQMVAVNNAVSFEYRLNSISEFRVESFRDKAGRRNVDQVFLGDEPVEATDRFWNSLYAIVRNHN